MFLFCFVMFSHRQNANQANNMATMRPIDTESEMRRESFWTANLWQTFQVPNHTRLFHCIITKPYHCTLTRDMHIAQAHKRMNEVLGLGLEARRYFYVCMAMAIKWIECDYIYIVLHARYHWNDIGCHFYHVV